MKPGRVVVAILFAVAGSAAALPLFRVQEAYPHEKHARLFPFCEGCHRMEATRSAFYPQPQLCVRCHDGEQEERVTWAAPAPEPTNLRFDHVSHARATANERTAVECASCHNAAGETTGRVTRSSAPACLSCHAHTAAEHVVDGECSECHVPVTQSTLTASMLAALSRPRDHEQPSFLAQHGDDMEGPAPATCQFCHARQQCTACHVNAASLPAIARLPEAPPSIQLPATVARYPTPETHERPDFLNEHGRKVDAATCSTCHTQESCTACHAERPPALVRNLPDSASVVAQGVTTQRRAPTSHALPAFTTDHGNEAATDPTACASCHSRTTCTECHNAPGRAVFHAPNFLAGHSSAAYSGRLECSNCHETRTFCRECHAQSGQTSRGQLLSTVFHDAEPLWLLRHGGAARRGLEGCVSCHAQRDCLQCHSTLGAFKVSPHSSDFDARRAQQRNPIICKACHVGDPLQNR